MSNSLCTGSTTTAFSLFTGGTLFPGAEVDDDKGTVFDDTCGGGFGCGGWGRGSVGAGVDVVMGSDTTCCWTDDDDDGDDTDGDDDDEDED